MTGARLASGDQPMDVLQIKALKWPQKGLGRNEPDRGRDFAQGVCSMDESPILDADAHPDVRGPGQLRRKFDETVLALGQNLKDMVVSLLHNLEHFTDENVGNALVEEV
jgi:hypothetical protein